MYLWRKLTDKEREMLLAERKARKLPWHSPPHIEFKNRKRYLITATCFEHKSVIGKNLQRLAECEAEVLKTCEELDSKVHAWCFLPNHYHILVET